MVTLRLTQSKEDGHWLHISNSLGQAAGINIENTFSSPCIIGMCIRQWAREQFDSCCYCSHEKAGDCRYEEVEESNGVIGYMNVEHEILHESRPYNCPLDSL